MSGDMLRPCDSRGCLASVPDGYWTEVRFGRRTYRLLLCDEHSAEVSGRARRCPSCGGPTASATESCVRCVAANVEAVPLPLAL